MDEIVRIKVENCFSQAQTYGYVLPFRVDEAFLEALRPLGTFQIKRNYRRPFFFLHLKDGSQVKGMLNDTVVKASYPDERYEAGMQAFEENLSHITGRKIIHE